VPLTFTAGKPKISHKGERATVTVPVKSSVAVSIKATLYRGKKVIFRWKTKAKAGSVKIKLVLVKKKLREGQGHPPSAGHLGRHTAHPEEDHRQGAPQAISGWAGKRRRARRAFPWSACRAGLRFER
jgi:hypothetical protein